MNINDYVYVYLFDINKLINSSDKLREDRFGIITNMERKYNTNGTNSLIYTIQTNNKTLTVDSDSLTTNIITISELLEIVYESIISNEKKEIIINQINEAISN